MTTEPTAPSATPAPAPTSSSPTYRTVYSTYGQSWGIGPRHGRGFFQYGFHSEQAAIDWYTGRRTKQVTR